MPSFLTNLAWPNRRADLSGSTADGYVIGYQVVGGLNQQVWGVIIKFTTAAYLFEK